MKSKLSIVVAITTLAMGNVQSAPDSEYLRFIKKFGGLVLNTYRLPRDEDLSYWGTDRDTYFYKYLDSDLEEKAPFWTKAYVNDDENPDYLFIMIHQSNNEAFLIGFVSSEKGYESIIIEPSSKYMAVATRKNTVGHFQLEGHGHGLSWDENERKFNVIN